MTARHTPRSVSDKRTMYFLFMEFPPGLLPRIPEFQT
jgi:hypothetical protein